MFCSKVYRRITHRKKAILRRIHKGRKKGLGNAALQIFKFLLMVEEPFCGEEWFGGSGPQLPTVHSHTSSSTFTVQYKSQIVFLDILCLSLLYNTNLQKTLFAPTVHNHTSSCAFNPHLYRTIQICILKKPASNCTQSHLLQYLGSTSVLNNTDKIQLERISA